MLAELIVIVLLQAGPTAESVNVYSGTDVVSVLAIADGWPCVGPAPRVHRRSRVDVDKFTIPPARDGRGSPIAVLELEVPDPPRGRVAFLFVQPRANHAIPGGTRVEVHDERS